MSTPETPKTLFQLSKVSTLNFDLIINLALNKHIPVDEDGGGGDEKVLVLISSLMAWDATPRKLEKLIQPGTEDPDEIVQIAAKADDNEDAGSLEGSEKADEPEPEPEKEASVKAASDNGNGEDGSHKAESVKEETEESDEEEVKKKAIKRRYLNHAFTEDDYKTR